MKSKVLHDEMPIVGNLFLILGKCECLTVVE